MAIIGEIRKRPTLIIVILGLALLSFVLTDLFSKMAGPSAENEKTVLIEGEQIDEKQFILLNELENSYSIVGESQAANANREHSISDIRAERLQAWYKFALIALIQDQSEEIGLETPEDELKLLFFGDSAKIHSWVRQKPDFDYWPHRNDPEPPQYQGYSTEYGKKLMNDGATRYVVSQLRLEEKYVSLLQAGMYVTKLEAIRDAKKNSSTRTIEYAFRAYNELSDSAYMPTEEEVKAYYQEHKNDAKYRDMPGKTLQIAKAIIVPSPSDKEVAYNSLKTMMARFEKATDNLAFIAKRSDNYVENPDPRNPNYRNHLQIVQADTLNVPAQYRDTVFNQDASGVFGPYEENGVYKVMKIENQFPRRARHILLSKDGPRAADQGRLADSIYNAIKSDTTGNLFGMLAMKYSDDPGSRIKGGDLGYFDFKTMVLPFSNKVFSLDSGQLGAVYSDFGLHIIEVTGIADTGAFKTAAFIEKNIVPLKETISEYREKAKRFIYEVYDGGDFQEVGDTMGFNVDEQRIHDVNNTVPGFQNSQVVYDFFKNGTLEEVSDPLVIDNSMYVLRIKKIYKKGPKDEEDTFESMQRDLINKKKAEAFKIQIANTTDLESIAMKWGTEVRTDDVSFADSRIDGVPGNDPKIVGALFGNHPTGTVIEEPFVGATGVYVIKIIRVNDPEPGDVTVNQNSLKTARNNMIFGRNYDSGLFKALSEFIPIKDNR